MPRSLIQTLTLGYQEASRRVIHMAEPVETLAVQRSQHLISTKGEPILMELINDTVSNPSGIILLSLFAVFILTIKWHIDEGKAHKLVQPFLQTLQRLRGTPYVSPTLLLLGSFLTDR